MIGLLAGGITPASMAFADDDKLKIEIEKEEGKVKIEIEDNDAEYKFELHDVDNEFIVDTILQYVDLPDEIIEKILSLDDSEYEFEYELETDFEERDEEHEEHLSWCDGRQGPAACCLLPQDWPVLCADEQCVHGL